MRLCTLKPFHRVFETIIISIHREHSDLWIISFNISLVKQKLKINSFVTIIEKILLTIINTQYIIESIHKRKEVRALSVKMEVWGDRALFTRPEHKAERVSYDLPTPSAARGMLEAVYFHPGLVWRIDKIYVLNPICFTNIRRNEVDAKILASDLRSAMQGGTKPLEIITANSIQQRAAIILRDVHYVIEAHFDMTDKASPTDNPGKFQDIIKRRLKRGQCFAQPYLGCRECTAHFGLWKGGEITTIPETRDLGLMLYDMDYTDPTNITPMFFRAQMVNGIVDVANCEVVQ